MKKRKMLPAYQQLKDENGLQDRGPLFTISFGRFSFFTVSLPLFSFIFCVAYSLFFFFEQSTSTHCHVWNYLPSISVSYQWYKSDSAWIYDSWIGRNRIVSAASLRMASFHSRSLSSSISHHMDVQKVNCCGVRRGDNANDLNVLAAIISELSGGICKTSPALRCFWMSSRTSRFWDCRFTHRSIITVKLSTQTRVIR